MKPKSASHRFDKVLSVTFPLYPKTVPIRVVFDPRKQIIRFKADGQAWKSMGLWLVFETAGGETDRLTPIQH